MRTLFFIIATISYVASFAQKSNTESFKNDTLFVITKHPEKGFYHDYILYIPKETPINKPTYLLVEPNNTGKTTDSIDVHRDSAIHLASVSSVGNNVSRMVRIPLLVPIFPRPASQELMYTHALDRDVMLEPSAELHRLDLQLLAMIADSKMVLESIGIKVASKVLMTGFSASATFINRFSFMHPETIKALAIGGFNGALMLPQHTVNDRKLHYPLGINDFTQLFGKPFDMDSFKHIPQFIYMGRLDDNDAVQYDDAYSEDERQTINMHLGKNVYERYLKCQEFYQDHSIFPTFKTYEAVGHWTTSEMSLDIIAFFLNEMQKQ